MLVVGVAAALLGAVAAGQSPSPNLFPLPSRYGDPRPDIRVDGRWIPVAELVEADRADWKAFERQVGSGWVAGFSAETGSPVWIIGPGVATGAPLTADAPTAEIARGWLERLAPALGVSRPADMRLQDVNATRNPHGGTVIGVDFAEHYGGFTVKSHHGPRLVRLRFQGETGRLFVLGSDVTPDIAPDLKNPLDRDVTFAACLERLDELKSFGPLVHHERYVLVLGRVARLVDEHHFLTENPLHRWVFIHDAATGDLIEFRDDIRHDLLDGSVSAGVLLNGGGSYGTFQVQPLSDVQVSVSGIGQTYTDAQGKFQVTTPDKQARTVSGRCYGRYANVQNRSGGNLSFSTQGTPGTPANIVMNPSNSELTTAQTTAYYHVTAAYNYLRQYYGPLSSFLSALPVSVNYPNLYCNAVFTGSGLYFFRAGGGCNNTAFAEIVIHEWGHAFHTAFHGTTSPGDFSEGIGDQLALFWTGQRYMGRGFYTNGGGVRDYRKPNGGSCCTVYPYPSSSNHKRGEAWAGTAMDMRDNLIARHGATKGVSIAETDVLSMYRRNPKDMPKAVFEVFVQDDNDANLLNGTPNFAELAQAADAHGFQSYRPPDPVIVDMTITHTPPADPIIDVVNAIPIQAKVEGQNGRTIKKVEILYGTSVQPMPLVGKDLYRIDLPPAQPLKALSYSIRSTSDTNLTLTRGPWTLRTGRLEKTILSEDFEQGWNGWTHAMVNTEDDWMLGPPNQSLVNPHDPLAAFSGKNLVGNDLAPANYDGDYSANVENYLESPAFDGGQSLSVWLKYRRWLSYMGRSSADNAVIKHNDGGLIWWNIWLGPTQDFADQAWTEHVIELTPRTYGVKNNKLRFTLVSDSSKEAGGWNIDDVRVESLNNDLIALRASNTTPPVLTPFQLEVEAVGGGNVPFFVVASASAGQWRVPHVQDPVLILPPFYPLFAGATGAGGKFQIPLIMPAEVKNLPIHFQALAASPKSGNILSNRLTVTAK